MFVIWLLWSASVKAPSATNSAFLREGRVVTFRKEGRVAYYRLLDEHVTTMIESAIDHARE